MDDNSFILAEELDRLRSELDRAHKKNDELEKLEKLNIKAVQKARCVVEWGSDINFRLYDTKEEAIEQAKINNCTLK